MVAWMQLLAALFLLSCLTTEAQRNNSCLVFAELPSQTGSEQDRQATILENGLEGWATPPKAFIDATGTKGLPTDLLRTSIPPLSVNEQFQPSQIQGVFNELSPWWGPILGVTIFGAILAIIFGVVGIVFCCCRCCGKCGGSKRMNKGNHDGIITLILGVILVVLLVLLFAGAVIALIGNQQVNDNTSNFNDRINSAITGIQSYFNGTVQEIFLVVDQALVVVSCSSDLLRSNLSDVGQTLVENVTNDFSNALENAGNSSKGIAQAVVTLNDTITQVDTLDGQLAALSASLDMVRSNLSQLAAGCDTSQPGSQTCADIRDLRDQLVLNVDTTVPRSALVVIRDSTSDLVTQLNAAIATTNETFNNIPLVDSLDENLESVIQSVINITEEYRTDLKSFITDGLDPFLKALDILVPGSPAGRSISSEVLSSISSARQTVQSSTEYVQNIQRVIYAFVIVMCCFVFVVVVVAVAGLICGIVGYKRDVVPWERSNISNCGAAMLLLGVGLMFLFGFLLLILTCIIFFLTSLGQKTCYSAGPESNYDIFTQFTDARVWGPGVNLTLFEFVDANSGESTPLSSLTAGGIILGCSRNEPAYQTFNLEEIFSSVGFSLSDIDNFTNRIPTEDELVNQLPQDVNFNVDSIISADTNQLLSDLVNGTSVRFNVSDLSNQLNQSAINITVDDLIARLENWKSVLVGSNDAITSLQMFVNTTVRNQVEAVMATQAQIVSLLGELESLEQNIRTPAMNTLNAVDSILVTLNEINVVEFLRPQISAVRTVLVDYANQYANYSREAITVDVGRCRPLFNTYDNLYVTVCEYTLVGLNAFWWSLGWCVLFFIPIIIVSVILSGYLARMKGPTGYDESPLGRKSSFLMEAK